MTRPVPFRQPSRPPRRLEDILQEIVLRDPCYAQALATIMEWRLNELNRQHVVRQPEETP